MISYGPSRVPAESAKVCIDRIIESDSIHRRHRWALAALKSPPVKSYAFGPFLFDVRSGELRKGSDEISVEPRVFALLAYLIENRGRLITREELLEKLWPDTNVSD